MLMLMRIYPWRSRREEKNDLALWMQAKNTGKVNGPLRDFVGLVVVVLIANSERVWVIIS